MAKHVPVSSLLGCWVCAFLSGACATTTPPSPGTSGQLAEQQGSGQTSEPQQFTLNRLKTLEHPPPLGREVVFSLHSTVATGKSQGAAQRFRGWDMDRDGRIDVLAIPNGGWVFDLNGDGKVDLVRSAQSR